MNISDYDYDLPDVLIANDPVFPRDSCNLMVIDKKCGTIGSKKFFELASLLKKGDVLVFNDSRVIPARIIFNNDKRKIEIFLTKRLDNGLWLAIGKPGKALNKGAIFRIGDELIAEVLEVRDDSQRLIKFNITGSAFDEQLKKVGATPLPPYIKNSISKPEDYQTVYARINGSVAAPTAGLHFTEHLMDKLSKQGVQFEFVTLHVGLGTFLPVKADNVEDHKMHGELFEMTKGTAERLNAAKKEKRRIIAVGTTAVRVLETSFKGSFHPGCGETDIFIYPGYKWKCVDALITNFHLPKSTLMLLVSSFAGKDLIFKAYTEAIIQKYRFYSYGDAMLIK